MDFDLSAEVMKAALALSMHKSGVELLKERFTNDEVLIYSEDKTDAWWVPVLDGFLVWTSKRAPGWGSWAEVRVSEDMQHLYVVADEYQPWGTGMEASWRVATYSAEQLFQAVQHAIVVAQSDFALNGLIENEETGRYEKFVHKPEYLTQFSASFIA